MDIETHEVLGLHVSGRSMATGTALALWRMRDWPILRDADVGFALTDAAEIEWAKEAVNRMAQTSHWPSSTPTFATHTIANSGKASEAAQGPAPGAISRPHEHLWQFTP